MYCFDKNFACNTHKCCYYCADKLKCEDACKDNPKKCTRYSEVDMPPTINWMSIDLKKWDTNKEAIRKEALEKAYIKAGRDPLEYQEIKVPKTLESFKEIIKDFYTDDNGQKFGKKKGTKTYWVVLKDEYVTNRGKSKINEADFHCLCSKLRKVKKKNS